MTEVSDFNLSYKLKSSNHKTRQVLHPGLSDSWSWNRTWVDTTWEFVEKPVFLFQILQSNAFPVVEVPCMHGSFYGKLKGESLDTECVQTCLTWPVHYSLKFWRWGKTCSVHRHFQSQPLIQPLSCLCFSCLLLVQIWEISELLLFLPCLQCLKPMKFAPQSTQVCTNIIMSSLTNSNWKKQNGKWLLEDSNGFANLQSCFTVYMLCIPYHIII